MASGRPRSVVRLSMSKARMLALTLGRRVLGRGILNSVLILGSSIPNVLYLCKILTNIRGRLLTSVWETLP